LVVSGARVVIADDHAPTRALLRRALGNAGFDVRADVRDAPSAVAAVIEHDAEVALLDVRMPGSGIAAASEIARVHPSTTVVMLTVSSDDADLFASVAAGAVGYLAKGLPDVDLASALTAVLDGKAALPPSLVRTLLAEFQSRDRTTRLSRSQPRWANLSAREREVLDLLAEGCATAEIAQRLFVSQVTVRTHISAILHKLEVPDRAAAVRFVRDHDEPST
jgi:two-component system, NarL family, nitrate/nitrite response regulator NarL